MSLEKQIEFSMCLLAQMTIRKLAQDLGKTDDEMAAAFMLSRTARMLFDRETGFFGNGPDYLANEYIEEISSPQSLVSDVQIEYKTN